jgi:hypothetical protein
LSAKELHNINDVEELIRKMQESATQRPNHLRYGQYVFNLLWQVNQWLAIKITDTDADPFHREENLPAFWAMIRKEHK